MFGISVTLLWSCSNSPDQSTVHQEAENYTAHIHDESSETIELNDGEKWIVNEEMKPFVSKGEELVNQYIQDDKTDYKALAEQVKEQNSQLIKSCTMDGKSHDELHKWLHSHLSIVDALENETNMAKANARVSELQHSYQQYHEYFN